MPQALLEEVFYSTNYYTQRAVTIIQNYSRALQHQRAGGVAAAKALWVHLAHQAVHAPITDVPEWEACPERNKFWDPVYADMLHVLDSSLANVTAALQDAGLWEQTLLIALSDNGGVGTQGNNFPRWRYIVHAQRKPSK